MRWNKNKGIYYKWVLLRIMRFPFRICAEVNDYLLEQIIRINKEIEFQKVTNSALTGFERKDDLYMQISIITHAGGGVDGCTYLNCREGLDKWIEWSKVFEIDVTRCTDGVYVCSHEKWQTDSVSFLEMKEDCRYTRMSLDHLLDFYKDHPEMVIIIDSKFNPETKVKDKAELASYIYKYLGGDNNMLDRIIIQIVDEVEIAAIWQSFEYRLLWNYLSCDTDFSRMVQDCITHNIHAVSLPVSTIKEHDGWQIFQRCNISVFAYTTDRVEEYYSLKELGVDGVFSNFLCPGGVEQCFRQFAVRRQ